MGVDEAELRVAVEAVEDPRLLHTLGELGTVRTVRAGRRGASVVVAVPGNGYGSSETLVGRVQAAAEAAGLRRVDVSAEPMDEDELSALRSTLRSLDDKTIAPTISPAERASATRVIGVSSGKGGVGKSSVAVNVAVALAALGRKVGLLDADVYGFSVPRMLGIEEAPLVIGDVVVPPVALGVRCISMGMFVDEEQAVVWRGPMLHKALGQFLVDVHWGAPDILVVDMPPGTGDVAMSLAKYLPGTELYVVTTPQAAAQRVAQRSVAMARQLKLPVRGVIENMSWFTGDDGKRYELFGAGGGSALADSMGLPLVAQVPFEPAVLAGGDSGSPVVVAAPESEAAQAFRGLAEKILATGPPRVYRRELTVH
jgi:ATP-binding protein involved in chromosome partitioning